MPNWLKKAVFYEIYPQSFYDTNGDGIGDIQGIIEKLDYISSIGANALWINPWYDSPFKDAGYDVRDYKKVAERYGTNEDAKRLFETAHSKGIKVLLDLVPGHTSEEHFWFKESGKSIVGADGKEQKNEYSDRYIWSDFWITGMAGHPYIGGECERNGTYMLNFFKCQPALNYGFANPTESWQMSYKDTEPQKTLAQMMDVMRFWLDMGCDGFRVDMADSLVKDDDADKSCTCSLWRQVREMLDRDYPEAAMVSEWSNPMQSINGAGFHMDFYLDHVGNGYNTLLRDYEAHEKNHVFGGEDSDIKIEIDDAESKDTEKEDNRINNDEEKNIDNKVENNLEKNRDRSYFKKNADGDITRFLADFLPKYNATKGNGYISFMTCNHDTPRAARTLDESELRIAYATLLTLPGVPFIYYGDEIGMRYIENMPTKEGGFTRTGTRTPMQWAKALDNMGFSTAPESDLYLPIDKEGPSVDEQEARIDSLLNTIREITSIRATEASLDADADFEVLLGEKGKPFIFRRGILILAVNPSEKAFALDRSYIDSASDCVDIIDKVIYNIGDVDLDGGTIRMAPQSFAIIK